MLGGRLLPEALEACNIHGQPTMLLGFAWMEAGKSSSCSKNVDDIFDEQAETTASIS